jgi:hypothetical protein
MSAELITLSRCSNCCPDQGPEGGAAEDGAGEATRRQKSAAQRQEGTNHRRDGQARQQVQTPEREIPDVVAG